MHIITRPRPMSDLMAPGIGLLLAILAQTPTAATAARTRMYPSSCAGSVVSFKTHKLVLFRLDVSLVLRASVVNLAHEYPLRFKTRMLINARLDFGLVLRASVVNLAHEYPLRFKTRMLINVRLDFGLVL